MEKPAGVTSPAPLGNHNANSPSKVVPRTKGEAGDFVAVASRLTSPLPAAEEDEQQQQQQQQQQQPPLAQQQHVALDVDQLRENVPDTFGRPKKKSASSASLLGSSVTEEETNRFALGGEFKMRPRHNSIRLKMKRTVSQASTCASRAMCEPLSCEKREISNGTKCDNIVCFRRCNVIIRGRGAATRACLSSFHGRLLGAYFGLTPPSNTRALDTLHIFLFVLLLSTQTVRTKTRHAWRFTGRILLNG